MQLHGERIGWILSAALHVGVALAAVLTLPKFARDMPDIPPPIAVEFVQISEKTQVVAPEQPEQQQEAVEEPKPEFARAEPVAAAEEEVVPLPEPANKVEELPKPAPKPEVSELEKLRSRVTVQTKPKPPSRLKTSRIAALIDKSLKDDTVQQKADEKKVEKQEPKKDAPKPDLFAGMRGRIATASLMQALQQKVYQCWSIPSGAKGVQDMQVDVMVHLASDGSIMGRPEFLNAGDLNDPDRAFFRVFAESARRAVQLCAPFPEAMDYVRETGQNEIIFKFSPRDFLGG